MQISHLVDCIKNEFSSAEMPFITRQLERVKKSTPYKGLNILHNIPFTKETILKLEVILAGGANLTVTSPSFMDADPELVAAFKNAGGNFVEIENIQGDFDIHLDCAAELLHRKPPKIGTVEITGTGTNKYGSENTNFPVISVDMSVIKRLEGVLGTGEAFVRAFKKLTNNLNLANRHFMIFGYGKVGQGIAHYLKLEKSNITIVEANKDYILQAEKAGFFTISSCNKNEIERTASKMFCVVTATGRNNVISSNYNPDAFKRRYLANMGGDDEFGVGFLESEVLCNKKPINFFIENPTLLRYLDPVFYCHNLGIDILLYSNLSNGLHPFPAFIAEEIFQDWISIFGENIL